MRFSSLILLLFLSAGLVSCKKEEAAELSQTQSVLSAPAKDDDASWRQYLVEVTKQNMGNISNSPFMYYLGPDSDAEFEEKWQRQVANVKTALARGIAPGNMLAFGSPVSVKMAELIENTFVDIEEGTMKGVRILFIGEADDNERVQTIVQPTGADYIFIEAK